MDTFTIGSFQLAFEPSGKLLSIEIGGGSLLHQTSYQVDLGQDCRFTPSGWDECFPMIEPYGQSPVMGDLIANPPLLRSDRNSVEQVWSLPSYVATRVFTVITPNCLKVSFTVKASTAIDFMWASHALFSVAGLKKVFFADGTKLHDFSVNGQCSKSFIRNRGAVRLEREDGLVELTTDQPWWGIWNNRGGWPAASPSGFACIGIEATSVNAETPQGTCLEPGENFHGGLILNYLRK